jgi:hypothetical protein
LLRCSDAMRPAMPLSNSSLDCLCMPPALEGPVGVHVQCQHLPAPSQVQAHQLKQYRLVGTTVIDFQIWERRLRSLLPLYRARDRYAVLCFLVPDEMMRMIQDFVLAHPGASCELVLRFLSLHYAGEGAGVPIVQRWLSIKREPQEALFSYYTRYHHEWVAMHGLGDPYNRTPELVAAHHFLLTSGATKGRTRLEVEEAARDLPTAYTHAKQWDVPVPSPPVQRVIMPIQERPQNRVGRYREPRNVRVCGICNGRHSMERCFLLRFGIGCLACGRMGHIAQGCPSNRNRPPLIAVSQRAKETIYAAMHRPKSVERRAMVREPRSVASPVQMQSERIFSQPVVAPIQQIPMMMSPASVQAALNEPLVSASLPSPHQVTQGGM